MKLESNYSPANAIGSGIGIPEVRARDDGVERWRVFAGGRFTGAYRVSRAKGGVHTCTNRQILTLSVDDFQQGGRLQNFNRLFGIAETRKLDDDLIVAPRLNQWLAYAELIDATLQCVPGSLKDISVDSLAFRRTCFEDNLQTTLQVESLMDKDIVI